MPVCVCVCGCVRHNLQLSACAVFWCAPRSRTVIGETEGLVANQRLARRTLANGGVGGCGGVGVSGQVYAIYGGLS